MLLMLIVISAWADDASTPKPRPTPGSNLKGRLASNLKETVTALVFDEKHLVEHLTKINKWLNKVPVAPSSLQLEQIQAFASIEEIEQLHREYKTILRDKSNALQSLQSDFEASPRTPPSPALLDAMRLAVEKSGRTVDNSGQCLGEVRQAETRPLRTDTGWFHDAQFLRDTLVAEGIAIDRQNFCAAGLGVGRRRLLNDGRMLMAFGNPDGMFKTGLCWMHSRFQRNTAYLADFHPERPKPTEAQVDVIVNKLARGEEVVPIPGFWNMYEFSKLYQEKITSVLNRLGVECVANGDCAKRIGDRSSASSAEDMRSRMDALYSRFIGHQDVLFARIELSKFGPLYSHSILVVNVEPIRPVTGNPLALMTGIAGYFLWVIDSNDPNQVRILEYRPGDTSLKYQWNGKPYNMMMYPDYEEDLNSFKTAIANYCKRAPVSPVK